ncbi:hypothetical protein [Paraburkholderia diazotrophica]|uniref:Uncharacterized protein n=1 Tax=Paraburkholderia diazotrophica TaxID=667676 RepID=A0A1H6YM16_9BURK|nr:hypothetical protein [Paraburkholderia diazotrophica]SEJ38290.1 hypothetical protein SAMN05192539_101041 [Paraburkholderia diazotrophica]
MQSTGIVLAVVFLAVLAVMHQRDRRALRAERRKLFDACFALFERHRLTQDAVAWPVLAGTYDGHEVHIAPLVDDVGFRKVPSLWLRVTVKRALPMSGTVDMLARAQNTEFYSPADGLPVRVATPHAWPGQMTIKADRPAAQLPLAVLDPHVKRFFADPRAKEMLVTQHGVRMVYQAHGAGRSEYLVLRRAVFRDARLPATLVRSLLDQAVQVCADVMKGDVHGQA